MGSKEPKPHRNHETLPTQSVKGKYEKGFNAKSLETNKRRHRIRFSIFKIMWELFKVMLIPGLVICTCVGLLIMYEQYLNTLPEMTRAIILSI